MNSKSLTLDMCKRQTPGQTLFLGRGDLSRPIVEVTVTDHGIPFDLTGKTAVFEVRTPSGAFLSFEGSVSGSTATFELDGMEPGQTDVAYVVIEDSTSRVSTERVRVVSLEGRANERP